MTDLVKRLQYQAGCKDPDLHKADVDLLWEAADRIEELQAENNEIRQQYANRCLQVDELQRKHRELVDGLQSCKRHGWTRKGMKEYPEGNLVYIADIHALLEDVCRGESRRESVGSGGENGGLQEL